jgi:hypothetical protein
MSYLNDNKKINEIYRRLNGKERFLLLKKALTERSINKDTAQEDIRNIFKSLKIDSVDAKENLNNCLQANNFLILSTKSLIIDNIILHLLLIESTLYRIQANLALKGVGLDLVKLIKIIKQSEDLTSLKEKIRKFIDKQSTKQKAPLKIQDDQDFNELLGCLAEIKKMNLLKIIEKDLGFLPPDILEKAIKKSPILKIILDKENE